MTLGSESGILAVKMNSIARSPRASRSASWLIVAHIFRVLIICLTVGLFIVSVPLSYEHRLKVCEAEPCPPGELTPASTQALSQAGMSLDFFVKITIALDILIAAAFLASAVIIFVRKPNDGLTIFVTIMLVTFGAATFTGEISGLASLNPQIRWLTNVIELIGNVSIIVFLCIFPSGRFISRWMALIPIAWLLFQLPRYYFPNSSLNLDVSHPPLYNLLFVSGVLSALATQVYRYWRTSNSMERQQTKWVVYGITLGVGGYIVVRLSSGLLLDPLGKDLLLSLSFAAVSVLFMLLLPISIIVAVVRYRLWDINPLINRTLVYGALSASTIALYIFAVGFASKYFQGPNLFVSFVATGVIAILFEPLRQRLQRAVNRLMYGERDDPATVLTRLSQRLDSAIAPESFLQTIVETLAQTLRLPYVAITLFSVDEEPRIASHFGSPPSELIHLPLTYQTERVGDLILAPRAEGESFSTADENLLHLIARQAGIAIHNLRLTEDLQRSREKLVTAQEEERRRLRRDLHDGVGPTLASFSQRIDTAADLINTNPQASIGLLKDLKRQVKNTVAEIRRLVYDLRPPVLDEFGLVTAIREHIAPYAGPNGLQITFDITDPMPALPAAVEVAAYRIALEAFTNMINHAQAKSCHIQIKMDNDSLWLKVLDDGQGLATKNHAGVGLTSMRERAAELGGEFSIENNSSGGTIVKARLPLATAQKE